MTLLACNLTTEERTEPMIWGSLTETPYTFMKLADTCLNASLVSMPAFTGQMKQEGVVSPFALPTIPRLAVQQNIVPGISLNGTPLTFAAKSIFDEDKPLDIIEAVCRKPLGHGASLIFRLYIYKFQKGILKFELGVFCESLHSGTVAFSPQQVVRMEFPTEFFMKGGFYNINRTGLTSEIALPETLVDGQGVYLDGIVVDFKEYPTVESIRGAIFSKAFAVDDSIFESFGCFGRNYKAAGEFLDYWGVFNEKLDAVQQIGRNTDLLAHLGGIGAMQASQTGFQGGFGASNNQETIICPYALWPNHYQSMQEMCRPVSYFDEDGNRIKSFEHPNWVTWAQRTHYNSVVSPDRLGRTYGGVNSAWSGYDREHDYSHRICNEVILNGSMLALDWIRGKGEAHLAGETLPSSKPGWSTNGTDNGRDMGRTLLSMRCIDRALPENDVLSPQLSQRVAARIHECIYPKFLETNRENIGAMTVLRIIKDDVRVFNGAAGWIPWEDSIALTGLMAWLLAFEKDPNYMHTVRQLREMIIPCAQTLALYGYHPTRPVAVNHYRWNAGVPWPESDYENTDNIRLGTGTDYHHWGLAGLYANIVSPTSDTRRRLGQILNMVLALGNKNSQSLWIANDFGFIEE